MHKLIKLFERYIIREISPGASLFVLLSLSALFVFLSIIQFSVHTPGINGILAQFQVLISLLLTIRLPIKGFVSAIILNCLISILAIVSFSTTHNYVVLPAIFIPLFTNLTITLIHVLVISLSKKISNLSANNAALTRLNAELSEAHKDLEQQNHILQSYSRVVNENQDRLSHLAFYDRLTNLPNRKFFIERIEALSFFSSEHRLHFYVLFIDLNEFRKINDSFGYQGGDYVLKTLAQKMKDFVHPDDLLARLDSDSFCVLIRRKLAKQELESYARLIRLLISEPILYQHQSISVKVSLAFDIYPQKGDITDSLLKRVNTDLPQLKDNPPEPIPFFNAYLP